MGHSHPQLEGCARGVTNDEKVALKYSWTFSAVMGRWPQLRSLGFLFDGGSELVSTRVGAMRSRPTNVITDMFAVRPESIW
jgi:hypothetical protein